MTILVADCAGTIGYNFALKWMGTLSEPVIILEKLTYAGNRASLAARDSDPEHIFVQGGIEDADLIVQLLVTRCPRAIVHFAAGSSVARSIHGPENCLKLSVFGTFWPLQTVTAFVRDLPAPERPDFRSLHVSTDKVHGTPKREDTKFTHSTDLDENRAHAEGRGYTEKIKFVVDCPGHHCDNFVGAMKMGPEHDWKQAKTFDAGNRKTVKRYLGDAALMAAVQDLSYHNRIGPQYGRMDSAAA